ncbi:MAG: hypothetical protein IJ223_04915 [Clostridia bacterium]|nr:hypothetical protein [Clostridia bacterium]
MMKKLFGGINLTWSKVIAMGIIMGIYTAIMAMLPIVKDTSFNDLTVTFEVWIFFGIFIIMNSKSAKDSAFKCFIFFLISQPLIYLIQDVINGSNLFAQFYKYWFMWTIACLPMGFIGYYMKKDKWWGILILFPMLIFVGMEYSRYLSNTIFSFPRHILTTIFCISTLVIYPLAIFENKIAKIGGIIISGIIIIFVTTLCILVPPIYSTDLLVNGGKYKFDDTYNAYLLDDKYGNLYIRYENGIEDWLVHAEFKKAGITKFVLESPDGEKTIFDINIKRNTYTITEHIKADKSTENNNINWNEITENGVDEQMLFKNINTDDLEKIAALLQNLTEEIGEKERADYQFAFEAKWYEYTLESKQFNQVLSMGNKAVKPLYFIIYKSSSQGLYEYICCMAIQRITNYQIEDWNNSKDFLEKFNKFVYDNMKEQINVNPQN